MDQAYLHPSDKAALAVLQKVPGFQTATKWVMKLGVEEYCRAQYGKSHSFVRTAVAEDLQSAAADLQTTQDRGSRVLSPDVSDAKCDDGR